MLKVAAAYKWKLHVSVHEIKQGFDLHPGVGPEYGHGCTGG